MAVLSLNETSDKRYSDLGWITNAYSRSSGSAPRLTFCYVRCTCCGRETNASLPDTLKNAAFDPDAVKVMTSAYEEATRRSRASGSFRPVAVNGYEDNDPDFPPSHELKTYPFRLSFDSNN
jgi:hypothetical protein